MVIEVNLMPLSDSNTRGSVSGLYFLFNNEKLVYIGKSSHIYRRVRTHIRQKQKQFNTFAVHKVSHNVFELESKLIEIYKPKYNVVTNGFKRIH